MKKETVRFSSRKFTLSKSQHQPNFSLSDARIPVLGKGQIFSKCSDRFLLVDLDIATSLYFISFVIQGSEPRKEKSEVLTHLMFLSCGFLTFRIKHNFIHYDTEFRQK